MEPVSDADGTGCCRAPRTGKEHHPAFLGRQDPDDVSQSATRGDGIRGQILLRYQSAAARTAAAIPAAGTVFRLCRRRQADGTGPGTDQDQL